MTSRVNWKKQCAIETARSLQYLNEALRMRRALKFYANPEVYLPDSTGRVPDLTRVAKDALAIDDEFFGVDN